MKRELKRKRYFFNFVSGGWNVVWAKTKRGAIAEAKREYKDSKWQPDYTTFQVADDELVKDAMSLFY